MKLQLALHYTNLKIVEELERALQEVWDSITIEIINSFVDSFWYRLFLVVYYNVASIEPCLRHGHANEATVLPPWSDEPTVLSKKLIQGLEVR